MEETGTDGAPAPAEQPKSFGNKSFVSRVRGWSRRKKILAGIAVFFVLMLLFAGAATQDAKKFADGVIADIQAGNCAQLFEMTSDNFRANTNNEEWNEVCGIIGPILQGAPDHQGIEVSAESGELTTAESSYKIAGTDDVTYLVKVQLEKIDGDWKLSGLDSSRSTP